MHLHYLESTILTGRPWPYLMVQDLASKAGLCWLAPSSGTGQNECNTFLLLSCVALMRCTLHFARNGPSAGFLASIRHRGGPKGPTSLPSEDLYFSSALFKCYH